MNATQTTKSLLVLGGPATGKTHYGAQLLGRLNSGAGALALTGAAANISPFENALDQLAQGLTADHTSTETYAEVCLPVALPGTVRTDLIWPDYGGEQIRQLLDQRRVGEGWRRRIELSDGWFLFVRPDQVRAYEDILSRPRRDLEPADEPTSLEQSWWSDQASYVELLQLLLYVKGVGVLGRVETPALAVILSCWDELGAAGESAKPADLLRARLPLLADFVDANWAEDRQFVFGLSSLGKALRMDREDDEYLERGPESFGYVIQPDGDWSPDLTLPVSALLGLLP